MGKAGRPRKAVPRTPSGQPSRAAGAREEPGLSPATIKRLMTVNARAVQGLEYGTPVGRLLLEQKISALEYQASRIWASNAKAYETAIDAKSLKAQNLDREVSGFRPDPNSAMGRRIADRERDDVDLFLADIDRLAGMGNRYVTTVREICEGVGRPPAGFEELTRLKKALSALALAWGIVIVKLDRQA